MPTHMSVPAWQFVVTCQAIVQYIYTACNVSVDKKNYRTEQYSSTVNNLPVITKLKKASRIQILIYVQFDVEVLSVMAYQNGDHIN
jgi:hypothetical protein